MRCKIFLIAVAIIFLTSNVSLAVLNYDNNGPGKVTFTQDASYNTTLTAAPKKGADFVGWDVSGITNPCTGSSKTCTINAASVGSKTVIVTAKFKPGTAYLLLHGLSSSTDTWNDLTKNNFNNSCIKMEEATFKESVNDSNRCFRLSFKTRSRMGLEGISEWPSGDGATYSELGDEVVKAVQGITASYPAIDSVVLIGHSRGGLSARSAVNKEDASVSKIKGVLTIGTPHQGSAFGRFYSWLEKYPRYKISTSDGPWLYENVSIWNLVLSISYFFDLRSPSVNFLAIGSTEIQKLNSVKLPTNIKYGAIASNNLKFGRIISTFDGWAFIDILWVMFPLPHSTKWLLDGEDVEYYKGDGIVHRASQDIPGVTFSKLTSDLNAVAHRDETQQTAAIEVVLRETMK